MPLSYCTSRFRTIRRATMPVQVGSVGVGGDNPIRIQSMTTSDTQDIAATVRQAIALAEVGCEIVRVTAPNVQAARCLRDIRAQFSAAGFADVPLVADIHFLPQAAMEAVEHVEKVRVNPGNYADKKRFAVREYTDADYNQELERLHEAFSPLVLRAKELGRSLRIGTNHGSLSDRIMNRYGDTPLGMVESALEFLRIAESHGFRQMILSMKASNPKVMIQAYRLLVARMQQENMAYPLHLGVTEAGDGEDGRIKSSIGIGSLLLDGLGDTIRVSLTEDSVYEIPVARAIAAKAMSLWGTPQGAGPGLSTSQASQNSPPSVDDGIDPFSYTRAPASAISLAPGCEVGGENPPRVVVRAPLGQFLTGGLDTGFTRIRADTPVEGLLMPVGTHADLSALAAAAARPPVPAAFLALELDSGIDAADLEPVLASTRTPIVLVREFGGNDIPALQAFAELAARHGCTLAPAMAAGDAPAVLAAMRASGCIRFLVTHSRFAPAAAPAQGPGHAVGAYRALAAAVRAEGCRQPVWIRNTSDAAVAGDASFLSRLIEASLLTGSLLCDGIGDCVSIETEGDPVRAARLTYNVLQGAGARISKTEFVACPSCGRTLFDLQTTTQRIRAKTGHLKGVKIAIMGCIVNGPGEMADADFGYVGGAPGRINLYVGRKCVQYNLPQDQADARLIELLREHGRWIEPAAAETAETV
ncbi:MAG: (E)-4-hydroxy-3-methylbut-2-enyl-diphosphate synthase [Opitutaceae bacterium]|nr:(E)-4-hydroxy-3-methylbut-2-enyl-diphosphate synthase [Opitutaceae bacterium]